MDRLVLRVEYISALTALLVTIALLFDHVAILFALGPTAYLLALIPSDGLVSAKDVLGSHLAAIGSGWLAEFVFTRGIDWVPVPSPSPALRIVASLALALGLTAVVLYSLTEQIATAHLTAAVVALGALSSPTGIGGLVVGVGAIAGLHTLFHGAGGHTTGPSTRDTLR